MSAISLLLSVVLLSAQDPLTSSNLYLRKTDGDVVSGKLISLEGDQVKLQISVLGGNMTVTRKLSDFEAASAYRIELAASPPEDFASHFAMARMAADMALLQQAGAEGRAALKAVEGKPDYEQKRGELRAWAAGALETMIGNAVAAGDLKEAQHCLKLLTTRLADQRTEEQIDAVADTVEALAQNKKDDKVAARQVKLDQRTQDSIERRLKPIRTDVDRGNKAYQDAVRKSRQTSASAKLCERAIGYYKKAHKALEALLKKHPTDENLGQVAAQLGSEMHRQAIRAALHAANMLTVQSDYKGAMDWAQRILAFEPDNAEAKQMVQTITMASATASGDWGWGWRSVGRGGYRRPGRNQ